MLGGPYRNPKTPMVRVWVRVRGGVVPAETGPIGLKNRRSWRILNCEAVLQRITASGVRSGLNHLMSVVKMRSPPASSEAFQQADEAGYVISVTFQPSWIHMFTVQREQRVH